MSSISAPAPPRILLAAYNANQSYMHTPSYFARLGVPLDAVFTDQTPLRHSHHLAERDIVPPARWARAVAQRLDSGRYTFFCNLDEPGIIELSRHRSWSPTARRLLPFDPDSPVAGLNGHKNAFYAWCQQHDLPLPETHLCADAAAVDRVRRTLRGAWMLKGDAGWGGQFVFPWTDPHRGELHPALLQHPGPWSLQKTEPGRRANATFLARHGQLVGWFAVQRVHASNHGFGPTVLGRPFCDPTVGELCARLARAGQLHGLSSFDLIMSADGRPLLIDPHLGRITSMTHFDRHCGVDLIARLFDHNAGVRAPSPTTASTSDFIKFPEVLLLYVEQGPGPLRRSIERPWRMPLAPAGDLNLALRITLSLMWNSLRILLGRHRQSALIALRNLGRPRVQPAPPSPPARRS